MTARKKSIRKAKRNAYGRPVFVAREAIGTVTVRGQEYDEVHVCAGFHGIAIVLYNTRLPHKERPKALQADTTWDAWDWANRPIDAWTLSEQLERLVVAVKESELKRTALNFMPTDFPTVLV